MSPFPAAGQFQPPHTGSHPLSKTMSLPSSPLDSASSPSAHGLAAPPASAHALPSQQHLAAPMQAHKSLPGSTGAYPPQPAKTPAAKRPQHPLAHTSTSASTSTTSGSTTSTSTQPSSMMLMSDRPDSDSEDSDAEVHVAVVNKPTAQKTPRVPPGGAPPGAASQGAGPAAGAGGPGAAGPGGGAPQKAPRKAMPPGRKAVAGALLFSFLARLGSSLSTTRRALRGPVPALTPLPPCSCRLGHRLGRRRLGRLRLGLAPSSFLLALLDLAVGVVLSLVPAFCILSCVSFLALLASPRELLSRSLQARKGGTTRCSVYERPM